MEIGIDFDINNMTVKDYYGKVSRLGALTMLYLNELFEQEEKYEECAKILEAVKLYAKDNNITLDTRIGELLQSLGINNNDRICAKCMADAKTVKFRIQTVGIL